jgi:hypothetical protein
LEKFPDSGRVIPEFPELPYREVIVVPLRFFYRVEGRFVWIVAAWHGAQPRRRGSASLQRAEHRNVPDYGLKALDFACLSRAA